VAIIEVRKTYKYRLYRSKRDFRLHDSLNISGIIWNHLTALQKRYYRLFGKHIPEGRMKAHIAKLRMKTPRFAYWRKVGSQAVQDICERHEKVYANFFAQRGGLPRFKKVKKYTSFTLKQAGWKLHDEMPSKKYRQLTIEDTIYKVVYHRPLKGDIKTVTIKRDAAGRLWVALKRGKRVILIDRWERTTQKCSGCEHEQTLELKDRVFCCENCGLILNRDHNAAINILEAGHRLILSQSVEVPAPSTASGVHVRSPHLPAPQ
jgi:transposase